MTEQNLLHKTDSNGWINPKDHFPDRDVILTYHADGSIRVTDLLGDEYESKITHWQPLPQPPKGTNNEI